MSLDIHYKYDPRMKDMGWNTKANCSAVHLGKLTMKFCWRGAQVNMGGIGLTALMVLMGTQRGSEAEEVTWVCLMTAWWGGASTEHTHTGPTPITVWSSCSSSSKW